MNHHESKELSGVPLDGHVDTEYIPDVAVTDVAACGPSPVQGLGPSPTGRRGLVFSGIVTRGRRLGRRLGVPTANLVVDGLDPALWGTWAASARTADGLFRAIAHLGVRPSVVGEQALVEVHLLGFTGDLYGRRLGVRLLERVAPELALPSLTALERKIHDDAQLVRGFFARMDAR